MMFFFEPQKKSFVEARLSWLLYLEINQPALRPFGPAEGVVEEQVQGRETAQALQGLLSSSHLHKTALRGRNSVAHTDALMPPLLSGHHSVMVMHKTWHKEGFCQNRFNEPKGTMQKSEVNKQTFRSWIGCRIGSLWTVGNIIFDILESTAV